MRDVTRSERQGSWRCSYIITDHVPCHTAFVTDASRHLLARPDQLIRNDENPRKYATVLLPTSPTSSIIWYKSPPRYMTVLPGTDRLQSKATVLVVWTQPVECIQRSEIHGKGKERERNGWGKKRTRNHSDPTDSTTSTLHPPTCSAVVA